MVAYTNFLVMPRAGKKRNKGGSAPLGNKNAASRLEAVASGAAVDGQAARLLVLEPKVVLFVRGGGGGGGGGGDGGGGSGESDAETAVLFFALIPPSVSLMKTITRIIFYRVCVLISSPPPVLSTSGVDTSRACSCCRWLRPSSRGGECVIP